MSLSDFLSRLRKPEPAPDEVRVSARPRTQASKGLPRFLAALSGKTQPVLVDLGSVVGVNITFFGEQYGCKIFIEDLSKDIDRHYLENKFSELPDFLSRRFPQPPESVDAIVCWDIFDYLDRPAGQALASEIVRLLRPEGVVLALFNQTEAVSADDRTYTRHVVVDQRSYVQKSYPAARGKQRPFPNRDIQRMFAPLAITDQFLLKTNVREVVFRKGAAAAKGPDATGDPGRPQE